MPARNATIEDLKKAYPTYCVQPFETTICKDCDEQISLYGTHVCRKYLERYSDRTNFVSQIQKLMSAGFEIDKKWLFKQFELDYNEEKQKMQKEYDRVYKEQMNGQVVEAMEKNKFIDGKTTLNSTLIDFNIMHGVAGIDYGKEKSKSIGTISQYWLNGSVKNFSVDWTMHPIYFELKNNINVKCEVDNNGKITGTVVSNLHYSEQWFLDFEQRCISGKDVQSLSHWQDSYCQGLWNFQIQLVGYVVETKHVPQPIYEVGSPKSFYIDCTICNQCDQADIYKPKTQNYTCQKCWPR